jgi:hypothetical protein
MRKNYCVSQSGRPKDLQQLRIPDLVQWLKSKAALFGHNSFFVRVPLISLCSTCQREKV